MEFSPNTFFQGLQSTRAQLIVNGLGYGEPPNLFQFINIGRCAETTEEGIRTPFELAQARRWFTKMDKYVDSTDLGKMILEFLPEEEVDELYEDSLYQKVFPHHPESKNHYPEIAQFCIDTSDDVEQLPQLPDERVDIKLKTHKCDIFVGEYYQCSRSSTHVGILPFTQPFEGAGGLKPWKPVMVLSRRPSLGHAAAVTACLKVMRQGPGSHVPGFSFSKMKWRKLHRCLGPKHWSINQAQVERKTWIGNRLVVGPNWSTPFGIDIHNANLTFEDCETLELQPVNATGCNWCRQQRGEPAKPGFVEFKSARDTVPRAEKLCEDAWKKLQEDGGAQAVCEEEHYQQVEGDMWDMDPPPNSEDEPVESFVDAEVEFGRFMPGYESEVVESDEEPLTPPAPTRRTRKRKLA